MHKMPAKLSPFDFHSRLTTNSSFNDDFSSNEFHFDREIEEIMLKNFFSFFSFHFFTLLLVLLLLPLLLVLKFNQYEITRRDFFVLGKIDGEEIEFFEY